MNQQTPPSRDGAIGQRVHATWAGNLQQLNGEQDSLAPFRAKADEGMGTVLPEIVLRSWRREGEEWIPIDECPVPSDAVSEVSFGGASWESRFTGDNGDEAREVSIRLKKGKSASVTASVQFRFDNWSKDNFVLVPGAVYNGNRFPVRLMQYPPSFPAGEPADRVITDVPRLEFADGVRSGFDLNTGDMTTPALGIFSPSEQCAWIVLTDQGGRWGNHGVSLHESDDRRLAHVSITAPVLRPKLYTMMNTATPTWDTPPVLSAGDEITIRFRLHRFSAIRVQDLFDRFAQLRKERSGSSAPCTDLPFSAAFDIIEAKYNRMNWRDAGYYGVGIREASWDGGKYHDWQCGWVGGLMVTHPLIMRGTEESLRRAVQNIGWALEETQSACGLLAPVVWQGRVLSDDFNRQDDLPVRCLIRRSGDALYFLIKQYQLLERMDPAWALPESWKARTLRLAEYLVRTFDREGELGQFVDYDTGDILVPGSTAGAIVPAGLALAGEYFQREEMVAAAGQIAGRYFERDARAGLTTGGPGEILQCPDSESAFGLLESLVILHECSGDSKWLPMALDMARQCMTWCVSYDHRFPPESSLGRLGVRSTGVVWANVQNKHGAPGICTLSGDALLKLFRATGDIPCLDLLQDIARCLPQFLCRENRQIGDPSQMQPGFICERVNLSDWEGTDGIGERLFGSCWPEVSMLLTAVEVPGIYAQPDTGILRAIDQVTAEWADDARRSLHIRNTSSHPARVTCLVESSGEARTRRLGPTALLDCPVVHVGPGKQVTHHATTPSTARPNQSPITT